MDGSRTISSSEPAVRIKHFCGHPCDKYVVFLRHIISFLGRLICHVFSTTVLIS